MKRLSLLLLVLAGFAGACAPTYVSTPYGRANRGWRHHPPRSAVIVVTPPPAPPRPYVHWR